MEVQQHLQLHHHHNHYELIKPEPRSAPATPPNLANGHSMDGHANGGTRKPGGGPGSSYTPPASSPSDDASPSLMSCVIAEQQQQQARKSPTSAAMLAGRPLTADRKRPYPCNLCVSRFGSKMELEEHQNSHTGQKPFECDVCKARFNRRSTLWNHKRIHSDAKPFVCPVCQMTFKWKNSLKCHKEMHLRKNESGVNLDNDRQLTYATAAKRRLLENDDGSIATSSTSPMPNRSSTTAVPSSMTSSSSPKKRSHHKTSHNNHNNNNNNNNNNHHSHHHHNHVNSTGSSTSALMQSSMHHLSQQPLQAHALLGGDHQPMDLLDTSGLDSLISGNHHNNILMQFCNPELDPQHLDLRSRQTNSILSSLVENDTSSLLNGHSLLNDLKNEMAYSSMLQQNPTSMGSTSLNVRIPLLNSLPMVGVDHLLGPLANGGLGSQQLQPSVHHLTTSSSALSLSDYSRMMSSSPGMPSTASQPPPAVQALPAHYLSSGQADLQIRINPTIVTHPVTYHPQQMDLNSLAVSASGLQPGDYMPNFDYMLNGTGVYATTIAHHPDPQPLANGGAPGRHPANSVPGAVVSGHHDVLMQQHRPNANGPPVGAEAGEANGDGDTSAYNIAKIVPYDQW